MFAAVVTATAVRKRYFWRGFAIKMIILPRQARDKHRESTQELSTVFLQAARPQLRRSAADDSLKVPAELISTWKAGRSKRERFARAIGAQRLQ